MITADFRGAAFIEHLKALPCYAGLDLAAVSDLTAFVLAWPLNDRVATYPWFFLPTEGLAERCQHDGVRYDLWARQGFLELTPGKVTEWQYVVGRIKQLAEALNIRSISYDTYGARDTVASLLETGIETKPFRQSYAGMGAPAKRVEALVMTGKLIHTGHPVLRWNMDCVRMERDYADNIRPVKPKRGMSSKRIDGIVAMIMAVGGLMDAEQNAGPVEFW